MKLTRKEILVFALVSTLIMAWSSIPDWAGKLAQNDQAVFTGTYLDVADYAVHISMLRAGMNGAWGYNFRFTSELHQTAYIRLSYILLGEINRPFGVDPKIVFQIALRFFGYTALFSIYVLVKRTSEDSTARGLAFFLAIRNHGNNPRYPQQEDDSTCIVGMDRLSFCAGLRTLCHPK